MRNSVAGHEVEKEKERITMLDIKFVRENQEAVAQAMRNRHASWDAERFSRLDEERRAAIVEEEGLQAERNATSKAIG